MNKYDTAVHLLPKFLAKKRGFTARISRWAIVLTLGFTCVACGNSSQLPKANVAPIASVTVSPSTAILQPGSSLQFISEIRGTTNTTVTWTATLGSITPSGLYTAPTATTATVDTVSAVSAADPTHYATASIEIAPAETGLSASSLSATASVSSPPSPTWFPYNATTSLSNKPLPSDVLLHCYGNTSNCAQGDAMAKYALTSNDAVGPPYRRSGSTVGTITFMVPGASDSQLPIYYGQSTDPWYTLSNCLHDATIKVSFHAPNRAKFSSTAGNDQAIAIYDTVQGLLIQAYMYNSSSTGTLPYSSCTSGPGCAVHVSYNGCSAERVGTDTDIQKTHYSYTNSYGTYTLGGVSAEGGFSSLGTIIRQNELMNGTVNHAVALGAYCTNPNFFVFPASGLLGGCRSNIANAPPPGGLIFTDYTPTQISSMLSAGRITHPQATLLTALSTYGGYLLVTGGGSWTGMSIGTELVEAQDAYKFYGRTPPIVPWGCQNGMNDYGQSSCSNGVVTGPFSPSLNALGGLPLMTGPEGRDTSGRSCRVAPGCDVSGHIHMADSCIAKRLAGLPGKC